ncbi:MAG: mechanosensitive ion channel family protein [Candidatus Sulfotelmatobacter sp.]
MDDAQPQRWSLKQGAQVAACCVVVAAALAGKLSADTPPSTYQLPSNSEVIGYLFQSVSWYRHVYAERQVANEPADFMFLDDNQPIERLIVKLSFDFAKAEAALPTSTASLPGGTTPADALSADLAHFIELKKQNDQLSEKADEEIKNLAKKMNRAKGADRRALQAAEEDAQTRLQILNAVAQGLNDLVEFVQSPGEGQAHSGHLDSTIDELAQSIPEVTGPAIPPATVPLQEATSRTAGRDAGILGLGSDVSAMKHKLHVVDEKILLTDNLTLSANNLQIPLAGFITQLIQSAAISNSQSSDLLSLREERSHLDALTLELKGLSPAIVALDKQKVLLTEYESHLLPWRMAVAGQYREAWKQFLIRVSVVLSIIGLLLAIAQLSRRFTLRHVHDPNRRRFIGMSHQFLTLFAITVVIVFALASDLKSVATYFGLLSAGLLLALENVILATLGSLLLVGRRGIRIGDRVQVSGVTGDVIDMGLLQFQLKEFDVENGRYTGHVATFSNSLVFVSPATGLMRFDSAPEKTLPVPESQGGTEPQADERVSIASD